MSHGITQSSRVQDEHTSKNEETGGAALWGFRFVLVQVTTFESEGLKPTAGGAGEFKQEGLHVITEHRKKE